MGDWTDVLLVVVAVMSPVLILLALDTLRDRRKLRRRQWNQRL